MTDRKRVGYSDVMSTLAVFLALAGGSIAVASVAKNDVKSKHVKDESLKSKDLKDGKAVKSADIADDAVTSADVGPNALTGADVLESSFQGIGTGALAQLPHARMSASGAQSIPDGNVTQIEFGVASPLSDLAFNDVEDSLTVGTAGVYVLTAELGFAANGTGRRSVRILVDGVTRAAEIVQAVDSTTAGTRTSVSTVLRLTPGDELTMNAQQTSGDALFTASQVGDFAALGAAWVSP